MSNLLSATEVAKQLGVSVRTVHRRATTGALPPAGKLPGATGAFVFDPQVVADYAATRPAVPARG